MIPAIIVTGASGFVGRHLLDDLKEQYRIFAIARRSQRECGAPIHPNIAWIQVDICDRAKLARAFREIQTAGGALFLVHLAAYYDFTGRHLPEYQRTNIDGTRHVLELSKPLRLKKLFFASSVAACAFPRPGLALNEASPPDGDHIYAWSKREGEQLLHEFASEIPSCIVRFGAVYSDWCEYPPLYMFLSTWLGQSWRSRVLAGTGHSAIPYIHIRDIVSFFRCLFRQYEELHPCEVFLACTPGASSHASLFDLATRYWAGTPRKPILMPVPLAALGLYSMNWWGTLTGRPPFERPWMWRYIDKSLTVDPAATYSRLDWRPTTALNLERRLPFLIERIKSQPLEWHGRNQAIILRRIDRPDLQLFNALSEVEQEICDNLITLIRDPANVAAYPRLSATEAEELAWLVRLLYRLALTAVQSTNRLLLLHYVQIAAPTRFRSGYSVSELSNLFDDLHRLILVRLRVFPELDQASQTIYDSLTLPMLMAKDELQQQFEEFQMRGHHEEPPGPCQPPVPPTAREQLEQTIWNCLVQRKNMSD